MDITTPQRLFHGTVDHFVPSFRTKLLDSRYWRPDRDFGEGFYTTISAEQARKWAVKATKGYLGDANPCVLEMELRSVPSRMEPLIFLSDSLAWATFILKHRKVNVKGRDPCRRHPDIMIGPMADNDTGKLVDDAATYSYDERWFYDRIVRSSRGRRLDSLRLGNQVVFASEAWESSLFLTGYYVQRQGRWMLHDVRSAESI